MNCKLKVKSIPYLFSVIALLGCILFDGCSPNFFSKNHYTYKVQQERLQQIDTLELTEAKDTEIEKSISEDKDEKAPADLKLSLEECRALALDNNLDLKVQLIEPAIAAEYVNEQEAKFEAIFSAGAGFSKTNRPSTGYLDEISGNTVDTSYLAYGVKIPLRAGGEITFDLSDVRTKSDAVSKYNPSYTSNFTASISQPLLRNAGKRVSTYRIQLAEYSRQIVDAQTKQAAISIISGVDRAYWRLYAARRLRDVRKQEYNLSKDLFEETERLVEVGIKAEIELLRTRAGVASSLEAIITSENTVRDMERQLKRMLNKSGLEMKTETELILLTEPDPVRYEFKKEQIVTKAIENRMDMLEMELRLAQDESTIEYRRNQLHPLLDLKYSFGNNSLGASRRDSYDVFFDNDYNDHTVSLKASIPLGNKAAKSILNQATYERAKRLASMDNKKALIEYEVLRDIDKLEASWQHIMASRQTTILRAQQFKAEKRQYELGMLTATDVLQAQTDLADAQRMEILAITQYQIALVDLAYTTGTLLGAARIELETIVPMDKMRNFQLSTSDYE